MSQSLNYIVIAFNFIIVIIRNAIPYQLIFLHLVPMWILLWPLGHPMHCSDQSGQSRSRIPCCTQLSSPLSTLMRLWLRYQALDNWYHKSVLKENLQKKPLQMTKMKMSYFTVSKMWKCFKCEQFRFWIGGVIVLSLEYSWCCQSGNAHAISDEYGNILGNFSFPCCCCSLSLFHFIQSQFLPIFNICWW